MIRQYLTRIQPYARALYLTYSTLSEKWIIFDGPHTFLLLAVAVTRYYLLDRFCYWPLGTGEPCFTSIQKVLGLETSKNQGLSIILSVSLNLSILLSKKIFNFLRILWNWIAVQLRSISHPPLMGRDRHTPISKFENMPQNLIAPIYSHKLYDKVCNLEFYLRVCVMMHVVWKTTESTEQKWSLPTPHPLPSLSGRKVFIGYYSLLRAYTDDLSGILRGKAFCSGFRSRLPLQIIIFTMPGDPSRLLLSIFKYQNFLVLWQTKSGKTFWILRCLKLTMYHVPCITYCTKPLIRLFMNMRWKWACCLVSHYIL